MSISATFIKRPIGTSLLAAALFLVGVAAWPLLPVAPLPQVDFPTIQVSVTLPGADPSTMASNVATPLERQFSLIAGLSQMTSTSALGTTSITLQFDLNRNIDAAAVDVQAAINAAGGQLPNNLPSPPTYRKINPADSPILIMSVKSDTLPLTVVNDYADNVLAQQISQIDGVGLVNIGGVQKPAIRIQLDPDKVAALGLDLETVRGALASATVNTPKGSFDGPRQSVTVYDNGQLLDPVLWNDVIVAYRGGAPVRMRDLGQAVAGPENARFAGWAYRGAAMPDGETLKSGRSVFLAVTKQPGANVIATVERIKAALPRLQASIPPAVEVNILTDRTQTIRASVEDVEFTLVLTGVLVVLVIFLFLRNLPATLIPAVTVPLAMMGTAAVMYVIGFSLDNLSLMALTISVGFVVDDAIVMLENIYRHVEDGMSPMEAAYRGAAEISFTIVSISVSLVAVFIP
ncbi:efflux RND transporter permease subunit, partial [Pandoraea apista]